MLFACMISTFGWGLFGGVHPLSDQAEDGNRAHEEDGIVELVPFSRV
jgi:hypothetical protein